MQDTKKAFRNLQKKQDVQAAANVLCSIKGVGPAMASGEPLKKKGYTKNLNDQAIFTKFTLPTRGKNSIISELS